MDSFFARFKNPLVLVAVVLLQTIGLAVQVQRASGPGGDPADGGTISQLRYWSTLLVTPFERVLHGGGSHVRNVWVNYLYLLHTRQQNLELQSEIARLREEQAAFAEDAAEGRRLQALLAFKQQYVTSTVAAQVIGTLSLIHI